MVILVLTLGSIFGISYYAYTHVPVPVPQVVADQPTTTKEPEPEVHELTTKTGKKIMITDTHPVGASLSTLAITSNDFTGTTSITIQKDPLTASFLADLNKDGFDELYLITTSAGSGSGSEVTAFASDKDTLLVAIEIQPITENDMKQGGLFEGYMGHDTISLVDGILSRSFPIYTASDTSSTPTGGTKNLFYHLENASGTYKLILSTSSSTKIILTSKESTTTPKVTTKKAK
jgi:hypothetical protein